MRDQAWELLGGVLLVGTMWLGYARWIAPRGPRLPWSARGALTLTLLAMAGGLLGAPIWWTNQKAGFSWVLPPLAARMLAAAAWSFVVATVPALERPSAARVRLVMVLLAVYLAPLVAAILLVHLDRFDSSALITYGFFGIAGGMAAASLWFVVFQPANVISDVEDHVPPRPITQIWLAGVAAITTAWGLALFATDHGPSRLIWVWPGDLLTSRLIGVMLLAIAAGAVTSLQHGTAARVMLAMMAVYGLGVVAANYASVLDGKPARPLYMAVFGVMLLGSATLLVIERVRTWRPPLSLAV